MGGWEDEESGLTYRREGTVMMVVWGFQQQKEDVASDGASEARKGRERAAPQRVGWGAVLLPEAPLNQGSTPVSSAGARFLWGIHFCLFTPRLDRFLGVAGEAMGCRRRQTTRSGRGA